MHSLVSILLAAVIVSACASSAPAQTLAKSADAKPAPQCYSGDDGKFHPVAQKATISGVEVVCAATADGKSAQWMSAKTHK